MLHSFLFGVGTVLALEALYLAGRDRAQRFARCILRVGTPREIDLRGTSERRDG